MTAFSVITLDTIICVIILYCLILDVNKMLSPFCHNFFTFIVENCYTHSPQSNQS
jgi:hypothetical protein